MWQNSMFISLKVLISLKPFICTKRCVSGKETNFNEQASSMVKWKHSSYITCLHFCKHSCYRCTPVLSPVPPNMGGFGVYWNGHMKWWGCEGLWVRGNEYVSLSSLRIHGKMLMKVWPLLSPAGENVWPMFVWNLSRQGMPCAVYFSLSVNLCSFPLQRGSLNYSFGGHASDIIYVHFTN